MSECFRSGENGRELQKGEKYDWKQEGDTYTLTINNPVLEDDGTYILLVKEVEAKTSGYLTVKKRDPEYWCVIMIMISIGLVTCMTIVQVRETAEGAGAWLHQQALLHVGGDQ